jgi:hypothetical protein
MATSRKYSTELMVQRVVEITKYGRRAEILDFSNNNFALKIDVNGTNNKKKVSEITISETFYYSTNEKPSADADGFDFDVI